jgi:hypothetical protein
MTEQPDPDVPLSCHRCGQRAGFYLYPDGTVSCIDCGTQRATLDPALTAAPGASPARPVPPSGPMIRRDCWYFTFGLEHPLRRRYVVISGAEEDARRLMTAIFGQGNWAGIYDGEKGPEVARRDRLTKLDLSLA